MAYTRINWQDLPSTSTPRNATNLNKMDSAIKEHDDKLLGNTSMGNVVVDSIRSKNMFNIYSRYVDSSGASYSYITNGIRITNTQAQDNNYVRFLVLDITNYIGKTLTLSAKAKSSSTNPACMYMRLAKTDGTSGSYGAQLTGTTTDGTLSVSYTIPSGIGDYHYLIVSLYGVRGTTASVNSYVDFTEIMLEVSSSRTTYTPYQELNPNVGDTGWLDIELRNGVTARSGDQYKPQYRRIGNVVYLKGQINIPQHTGTLMMFGLPVGFKPICETRLPLIRIHINTWLDVTGACYVSESSALTNLSIDWCFLVN